LTKKKLLGWLILGIMVISYLTFMVIKGGFWLTLIMYSGAAVIIGLIYLAIQLIDSDN